MTYLWRAVDNEETVLDVIVQTRRKKSRAAHTEETVEKPRCQTKTDCD